MKILVIITLFLALFAPPKPGDWVCKADPLDAKNMCSAFDYDADLETAKKKAVELCIEGCRANFCKVIECLRVPKDK